MASTITTAVVTGGSNSHATTVSEINATRSDFGNPGVTGVITANSGSGGTGSFCVNADASPDMGVTLKAGSAYIKATPAGQTSQLLRANMASDYTSYTISANASGSTKYDWIYLSVDATKANNPASDASDVTSVYTSRSSSNTTDNGSPPTYGLLLAIVTVANGASSITNSNITDKRVNASWNTITTTSVYPNFVESGCIWTGDSYGSTLNASQTSGYVWISGKRLTVAAVSARAFTASKDTYVDLSDNLDGTAAFTYTAVNNGATSPALAAGALRIAKIVTGASSIAAASSISQATYADSLGNIIYPKGPASPALMQNPYKFSVYLASNVTANADPYTVLFDTKEFDTGSNVDVATNKGRFTAPIAGYYFFSTVVRVNVVASNAWIVSLYKNGSRWKFLNEVVIGSSTFDEQGGGSVLVQLAVNDYIEVKVENVNGDSVRGGQTATWFTGFLVSAT